MKLYGFPMSPNSRRAQIALEEVAAPYEYVMVDLTQAAHRRDDYLALNPSGRVPTLVDGATVVFESHAICQYIAAKFPEKRLDAESPEERADISKWLFMNAAHFGPALASVFAHSFRLPEDQRNPKILENGRNEVKKSLDIISRALGDKDYLAAGRFTLVEIAFVPSFAFMPMLGFDLSEFANLTAWHKRTRERAAVKKVIDG